MKKQQSNRVSDWYESRTKPEGGFVGLHPHQVLIIWWARVTGLIGALEFKLWWAAVEILARRACREPETPCRFDRYLEWAGLIGKGVSKRKARRGLRKLGKLGLLDLSKTSLRLIESPDELRCDGLSGYWELFERVGKAASRGQSIPVPRRIVRLLAGGLGKGISATIIAALLRCLRRRKVQGEWTCVSGGLLSTSWVADVFSIGHMTVKHALSHLVSIGWITRLETTQWVQQKHGAKTVINLSWRRPVEEPAPAVGETGKVAVDTVPVSEPLITQNAPISEPLKINKELPTELKNQEPALAADRPSGVCNKAQEEEENNTPRQVNTTTPIKSLQAPTMKHVEVEDLRETTRTLQLFEDAVRLGLTKPSEADRLKFVAAAERAITVGTRNPCGFFARIVRSGLWGHITQGDEDAGARRLKRHFFGDPKLNRESTRPMQAMPIRQALSRDAKLVVAVKRVAGQHRITGDPFHLLRRECPDWSRERWERAEGELENHRLASLRSTMSQYATA